MTEGEDVDGFRVVLPPPDPDSPPIVIDKGDGPTTVSSPTSSTFRAPFHSIKAVDHAAIANGDYDEPIREWVNSLPPVDPKQTMEYYLDHPSMWEPEKSANPETMRQAWADAHDEFQRRMRGEGLRIDPTEGATDD